MRETVIEKYLMKRAKEHGFLCWKFISPSMNGVPDRILIGHGTTVFIETKAPGQKPRPKQKKVFSNMEKHGATVHVIDTKEKVDRFFDGIKEQELSHQEAP